MPAGGTGNSRGGGGLRERAWAKSECMSGALVVHGGESIRQVGDEIIATTERTTGKKLFALCYEIPYTGVIRWQGEDRKTISGIG